MCKWVRLGVGIRFSVAQHVTLETLLNINGFFH
jgi:hypothetical protein